MAISVNWADVTAKQVEAANQQFMDGVKRDTFLFGYLPQFPPSNGGKSSFHIITDGMTAHGFREGEAFRAAGRQESVKVDLEPGYFVQTVRVSKIALDAYQNASASQVANFIQTQFDEAYLSLVQRIETAIHGGVDSETNFIGLATAIEDGGTYGTLDRSTVVNGRSYVNDAAGVPRALTSVLLNATHKGIVDTNGGLYDIVLTSMTQGDNIRGLTADVHKLGGQVMVQPGQPMELSHGIGTVRSSGLRIRGAEVLEVPGYPTDRIDYLNIGSRQIGIEVHRQVTVGEMKFEDDDIVWNITWGGQLVNRNPRKNTGRLGDLS